MSNLLEKFLSIVFLEICCDGFRMGILLKKKKNKVPFCKEKFEKLR